VIVAAALRIADYLRRSLKVLAQARVGLAAANGPEYAAAFYGITLAGAVVVPLPERLDDPLLSEVLADADTAITLADPKNVRRIADAIGSDVERLDLSAPGMRGCKSLELLDQIEDPALMLYTSGSTGKPKGVLLSHRNLLSNAASIRRYLPIAAGDRTLALLPFCHAYGNSVLQTHLLAGATVVVDGSTTFPNSIVDVLEAHRINSFAGVPEMYNGLLRYSDLGTRKLPQLRYMTVAGAAMSASTALEVADRIRPAQFIVMYGQTEATARLAFLPAAELRKRPTSIGRAIPNVELRIINEAGAPQAVGQPGELCARGPNIMLGYWRDAAGTAAVIRDGWLHTGDLATVDDEGFFYVVGRLRDQVKICGQKAAPGAITETLAGRLPGCQVAVVPFQGADGTRLALFVAAHTADDELAPRIRRVCSEALRRHERPSYVEVLEQLPLTPSLKVDGHLLAQRAAQRVIAAWGELNASSSMVLKRAV
jgi:acyl-CoA synthetase (AMP-forming)/AMP-acid ligase II